MSAPSQVSIRIFPEILRSLAYTSISGTYMGIGTPLIWPSRIIMFQNSTDQDVFISWDGINDNQYLPSKSFTLLDVSTNKITSQGWFVGGSQRFYARQTGGTSPTSGSVYVTSFYGLSEGG